MVRIDDTALNNYGYCSECDSNVRARMGAGNGGGRSCGPIAR
mgnify:CR=1 FL=1